MGGGGGGGGGGALIWKFEVEERYFWVDEALIQENTVLQNVYYILGQIFFVFYHISQPSTFLSA